MICQNRLLCYYWIQLNVQAWLHVVAFWPYLRWDVDLLFFTANTTNGITQEETAIERPQVGVCPVCVTAVWTSLWQGIGVALTWGKAAVFSTNSLTVCSTLVFLGELPPPFEALVRAQLALNESELKKYGFRLQIVKRRWWPCEEKVMTWWGWVRKCEKINGWRKHFWKEESSIVKTFRTTLRC